MMRSSPFRAALLVLAAWTVDMAWTPGQEETAGTTAPSEPVAGGGANPTTAAEAKPFRFTIPGTTVALDLVPVALADGTTLWFSTTEVPWEVYDALVFELDRPEDERGTRAEAPSREPATARTDESDADARVRPDAVARPTKPYIMTDRGFGHDGYPAISISKNGAEACCTWLTAHAGVKFRLPTESEWEYAARGGANAAAPAALAQVAWFKDNAEKKTHPVGTKPANAFGLRDMLGNVAEWCTTEDGKGAVRGGSYLDPADAVGFTARKPYSKAWNASDPQIPKSRWWLADGGFIGFRVVCEGVPKT